jgi:N-acetylglutamate synthase-like GNAT family acetyltransferase
VRQELISYGDYCKGWAGVPKLGQRGEVQDLMAKAFVGSNPTPCMFTTTLEPQRLIDRMKNSVVPTPTLPEIWVATCNAAVVGLVGLVVQDTEAEVEPLIVHKEHRRHGVEGQLTQTVIAEARKLNIRFLSVKPVARNIQAIKFFHHRGFRTLGHTELFLDLSKSAWKPGPRLFDCDFTF